MLNTALVSVLTEVFSSYRSPSSITFCAFIILVVIDSGDLQRNGESRRNSWKRMFLEQHDCSMATAQTSLHKAEG